MNPTSRDARVAGVLYLLLAVTGVFNLIYVPSRLFVRGDAAATARTILANESLYRVDIAVGVVGSVVFLFLALALHRLLAGVSAPAAMAMVALVMVQVPQSFVTELVRIAALVLLRSADLLAVFDASQREALAALLLRAGEQGAHVSEAFWGLWLFPLGWLVFRSRFLPQFLGAWLIANGVAYLSVSFTGLLLPQHLGIVSKVTFPLLLGEVAFMLWLLIRGVKPTAVAHATPASAARSLRRARTESPAATSSGTGSLGEEVGGGRGVECAPMRYSRE